MIKLIREGSQKYPWFLKLIVLIIAVTFVIGMGWFGYVSSQQPNDVAFIGPHKISLQAYRQAYQSTYRFYKDQLKQEISDEEDFKKQVIEGMVGSKLWLIAANELSLAIPPEALKQAIMERKEFQQDGKFSPKLYHRILAANQKRFSITQFERQLNDKLLAEKIQFIVQDVAMLSPSEMKEVEELVTRQTTDVKDEGKIEEARTRIRLQMLMAKKQRVLKAFQGALRNSAKVEIREEYL